MEFLQRQCADEPEILREVRELLDSFDAGADELDRSPVNLFSEATEAVPADAVTGYRIIRELHRGGQGVVYLAVQLGTKREVALKILLEGPFAGEASRRRFEREVELAGSLRHPGVVPVFDSGIAEGKYFFAMEYVRGATLREYVKQRRPTVDDTLRLFAKVCAAVDYAHQHGVIHRDLKPSNILVDETGEPRIVDFGLARVRHDEGRQESVAVSLTGQVMGTPAYMSPEQASGHADQVDMRSDVYSLGAVLYELLTGQLPYELDGSLAENLETIRSAAPRSLRSRRRQLSYDVETIVLKALAKEKERRYPTAGGLGEDIRRYLAGDAVEARRDSLVYVLTKTIRRHMLVAATAAAFAGLLLVSSIVAWSLYVDAERARAAESQAALRYRQERDQARRVNYRVEMNLAGRVLQEPGGIARVAEIVNAWDPAASGGQVACGWEWYYLRSRLGSEDARHLQFDELVWCVCWSPDGKWIATGDQAGLVRLHSAREPTESKVVATFNSEVRALAWSPDSRLLASGSPDRRLFVDDVTTGQRPHSFVLDDHVNSVAWHPQGTLLAAATRSGTVTVWEMPEGQVRHTFDNPSGAQTLDWSPQGSLLAVGHWNGRLRLWDVAGTPAAKKPWSRSGAIFAVCWSPDGKLLATGDTEGKIEVRRGLNDAVVWSEDTQRPVWNLKWNSGGDRLASIGSDGTVRVWRGLDGKLLRALQGHTTQAWAVDWSPDSEWLVSGSHDKTVRFWMVADPQDDRVFAANPGGRRQRLNHLAWSPDDTRIAAVGTAHELFVLDAGTGEQLQRLPGHTAQPRYVSWSPDGRRLATSGFDETAIVWNAASGEIITRFEEHRSAVERDPPSIVHCVRWSPDSSLIASGDQYGTVLVWNPDTAEVLHRYENNQGLFWTLDWNPTANLTLALGTMERTGWLWRLAGDSAGVAPRKFGESRSEPVACVRWNATGTRLAVAGYDGRVIIHDARSGNVLQVLKDHSGPVLCVDWHGDGSRLATASEDNTVRVWDSESGLQTIVFRYPQSPPSSLAWSHDGRRLAVGDLNGDILIRDASAGYSR